MEADLRSSFPARAGGLCEELRRFLRYCNTDRAHTGRLTKGCTPEEVLGAAKMVSRYGRKRRYLSGEDKLGMRPCTPVAGGCQRSFYS